jgi:hypothetical protein
VYGDSDSVSIIESIRTVENHAVSRKDKRRSTSEMGETPEECFQHDMSLLPDALKEPGAAKIKALRLKKVELVKECVKQGMSKSEIDDILKI